jgi:RNA polymerase sigma-70 factor (ECF subfamily)
MEADAAYGAADLADAVRRLSIRQRQAFMLVGWLGMSADEAASLLHIAPASVRSRVHRAREELKRALSEEEDWDG